MSESHGGQSLHANPGTEGDGNPTLMAQSSDEDEDDEDENDDEAGNGDQAMHNGADDKDFGNVVPDDVATVVHTGIPARPVDGIMRAVDKARKKSDPVSAAHFLGKPRLDSAGKPARGPAFTFGEVAIATKACVYVAQVGHCLFLFLCGHF